MKRRFAAGLALIVGLGLGSVASAAEHARYVYLGVTPGNTVGGFFDKTSVKREGDKSTVTLLAVFPTVSDGAAYFQLTSTYDCTARTSRNLSGAFYAADGSTVSEENTPEDKWYPVAENDDVDRQMFDAACKGAVPSDAKSFKTVKDAVKWFGGGGR